MVSISWTVVHEIGLASIRSVLHAGTLAAAGIYMGRTGVMTKEVTKAMSSLSMKVTIPALLFTSVLPAVNIPLLYRVWPMFFFPMIYASIGAFIGYMVILICKPPDDFRCGTIAAIAFGNSTGARVAGANFELCQEALFSGPRRHADRSAHCHLAAAARLVSANQ